MAKDMGNPAKFDLTMIKNMFSVEERFILSKLNNTIEKITKLFNDYKLDEVPVAVEELFLALSRTYIQLIRDKSSVGSEDDKKVVAYTLYKVIIECLKLFAPIAPFISEKIYQNLKQEFGFKEESIHLFSWPKADKKMIDGELEKNMSIVGDVIQGILFAREKIQQGLRWPLKEVLVVSKKEEIVKAVQELDEIIKMQTNVKEIHMQESLPGIKQTVKADYGKIGPEFQAKSAEIIAHISTHSPETVLKQIEEKGKYGFDIKGEKVAITKNHLIIERTVPSPYTEAEIKGGLVYINPEMDEELETEGYAREVMRRVQALRKKAGLEKQDKIILSISVNEDLVKGLSGWGEQIQLKCGASKIKISELKAARKHEFADKVKIRDYEFEISFDKV